MACMGSTEFKGHQWSCVCVCVGTDLIDDGLENLSAQKVSRDGQFSIEKSHSFILRVLYIKTGKVEHLACSLGSHRRSGNVSVPCRQ